MAQAREHSRYAAQGVFFVLSKLVRSINLSACNTQGVSVPTLMLSTTSPQNIDVSGFGTIWFEKKSVNLHKWLKLDVSIENS